MRYKHWSGFFLKIYSKYQIPIRYLSIMDVAKNEVEINGEERHV